MEEKKPEHSGKTSGAEMTPEAKDYSVESGPILERLKAEAPEIIKLLSAEKQAQLARFTSQLVMKHHQGPLPCPEDIALYNQYIPNGADRIMAMAEKESEHRRTVEWAIATSLISQSSRGQLFGLLIGVFGIVAGAVVTIQGHDAVGAGIAGATVISLVYAFITGQRGQRNASSRDETSGSSR